MAAVDPYAPCPCGSGEKFKWCCQKVESFADKAERLIENGQFDAAQATLDEGLRKVPDNPWLLTRKALLFIRKEQSAQARPLLERIVARQPTHLGAQGLLVRVVLETEGPAAGVAQLQQALSVAPPDRREELGPLVQVVGMFLTETGHVTAAAKHLELADRLVPDEPMIASALRAVEGNPASSAWLRNPYRLAPAPENLHGEARDRFDEATRWADEGLWSSAASAFQVIATDNVPAAERNLGLCRLWLADDAAAVDALRQYVRLAGPTAEAVDLEATCQQIAPPRSADDLADRMHLIWPLKRREELLAALGASGRAIDEGKAPLDPDDPNSFEVDQFAILDRPKPEGDRVTSIDGVPRIVGRALVGGEIVILETYDDGRLEDVMNGFRELAGAAIPPAHPKTKVVEKVPRSGLALSTEFWLPPGLDEAERRRLHHQERARVVREVWPNTPMPYLNGRTPRQAAKAGDAKIALRAAVCQLELGHEFFREEIDFAALRAELGIGDEPAIDPEGLDVESVHLARLHRVPADRLDDDRLVALWDRARRYVLPMAMERAARAIAERPGLADRESIGRVPVFADLANLAMSRQDVSEAFRWIERGRRDEPSHLKARNAVRWDMTEVRLRARSEKPEQWVPQLAVVLERYREDRSASQTILTNLMDMGLLQMVPNPDNPEEILLDSRTLQAVLTRYGPKITTATGELGVSAAKGGIWTPDSGAPAGSGGGIWTPGSPTGTASGGDKPRLIIPGR